MSYNTHTCVLYESISSRATFRVLILMKMEELNVCFPTPTFCFLALLVPYFMPESISKMSQNDKELPKETKIFFQMHFSKSIVDEHGQKWSQRFKNEEDS